MMTDAGLRRSVGVDDVSSVFRSHHGTQRSGPRPDLAVGHRRSAGPEAVSTGYRRGEGDCRASFEHWRTEHRGSTEVCRVQLRDDESRAVQDALYETPTAQVAVRSLRTQLYTPVGPTVCSLDISVGYSHFPGKVPLANTA